MNIRAIALCVLLAQSLGVCPARAALITPIHTLMTYLNPVDNIAQDKSLFQAEQDRITTLVKTVYNLPARRFSLIVVDELLSSTAPTEGEAATWGICYGLAQLPNCITLAATHFPRLTSLPAHTNGFFKNYQVSAIKEPNGGIKHTFKLDYGPSQQIIALDLARQAGFDPQLIARAETFLKDHGS